MKNLKFVPFHKTNGGIVTGELRVGDVFQHTLCTIEETNANEIINCINRLNESEELLAWAYKVIDASVPKKAGHGSIEILPKIKNFLPPTEKI